MSVPKNDIIRRLERDILPLQGFKPVPAGVTRIGLGPVEAAFPGGCFPAGGIHECISALPEEAAATTGFTAGIIAKLMHGNGAAVWIGTKRKIFPPALKAYGLLPERIIFADVAGEKDALWVMEEALKCEALTAVIGEITHIDFKSSRRLQLATEKSRVTGFLLRNNLRYVTPVASLARWKISPLPGNTETPGVGRKRWHVTLEKVRNGKPGSWEVEWNKGGFKVIEQQKQPVWQSDTWQYGSAI